MNPSNTDGTSDFAWFCNWVQAQCDGEWEHGDAAEMGMLDNPGWRVKVGLSGTRLQDVSFAEIREGDSDEDDRWLHCRVEDDLFMGEAGIQQLPEILGIFRAWAEKRD